MLHRVLDYNYVNGCILSKEVAMLGVIKRTRVMSRENLLPLGEEKCYRWCPKLIDRVVNYWIFPPKSYRRTNEGSFPQNISDENQQSKWSFDFFLVSSICFVVWLLLTLRLWAKVWLTVLHHKEDQSDKEESNLVRHLTRDWAGLCCSRRWTGRFNGAETLLEGTSIPTVSRTRINFSFCSFWLSCPL